MSSTTSRMAVAVALATTGWTTGCTTPLICADGTLERDGECVSGGTAFAAPCGPGTHFDELELLCVPDLPPTVCDLATTVPEPSEDGVTVCVGGGTINCDADIACPAPTAGNVTVCGRILDLETGARIEGDSVSDAFEISVYDALAFAANPNGAETLGLDELLIDSCGRYRAVNVDLPFNGSLGIAVRDAPGAADDHADTGVGLLTTQGSRVKGVNVYATRRTTDAQWTADALDPFTGQTFSEVGVYVPLFRHDGLGVEGVRVTAGGTVRSDAFYFSDPDQNVSTVAPGQTSTGPNGAALLIDSSLAQHSGQGGELDGCTWVSSLAATIPGVVFVQEREMLNARQEACESP